MIGIFYFFWVVTSQIFEFQKNSSHFVSALLCMEAVLVPFGGGFDHKFWTLRPLFCGYKPGLFRVVLALFFYELDCVHMKILQFELIVSMGWTVFFPTRKHKAALSCLRLNQCFISNYIIKDDCTLWLTVRTFFSNVTEICFAPRYVLL